MNMFKPPHPGRIAKELLIDGAHLSVTEAASKLGVTRTTLSRFLNEHAGLSPEMALRLSKLFGNSIDMWLNLQTQYDKWQIIQKTNDIHVDPLDDVA